MDKDQIILDPYFSTDRCVDRLLDQYKIHNNLIIGFDFDDTIYDCHLKNYFYPKTIKLLEECSDMGFTMILYTAEDDQLEINKIINKIQLYTRISISYVNECPIMNTKKPFFNILLDDKAGLGQAYNILDTTIKIINLNL